jgi:hypothetical protein
MSETKAPWSPARAVLPPDPNGHNRALDRVAAEHLREVAPGLAASPAPPQPEPAKANAPRKGSKAWAIQEACRIVGIAFHGIAEYDEASDCFCSESRDQDYRNGGHALAFVEAAVREKLAREKSPAPEATGEHKAKRLAARLRMNAPPTNYGDLLREAADYLETIPETERQMRAWRKMAENPREPVECKPEATGEMAAPAVVASVYCTFRDMLGEIDSKTTWMRASLTELEEEYVKARTRAREAEGREAKWRRELSAACELSERAREIVVSALNQPPEHYYDKHDNGEWSAEHIAFAIRSLFRERDEAREQRDDLSRENKGLRDQRDAISDQREDLANEILVERAARGKAEEYKDRLRGECVGTLTDVGAYMLVDSDPTAPGEVASAIRRVARERDQNAARLAAAEARIARLVRAGDDLARWVDPGPAVQGWAAAKADAPAAKETK